MRCYWDLGCEDIVVFSCLGGSSGGDIADDATYAFFDAIARFVPGEEGKEDCVVRVECDAFG